MQHDEPENLEIETPPLRDDDSIDHVGFEITPDYLARPRRKPPEPGLMRTLFVAMMVGVSMGVVLYFFKPTPRSAEARPSILPSKMMNTTTEKVELFQLPEWNEEESPAAR